MDDITNLLERARVVLTAVVAWLVAAAAALTAAAGEISELAPEDSEDVVAWILRAVAVLAGVVAVLRRVTPVPEHMRGLLVDPALSLDTWDASNGGEYRYVAPHRRPTTEGSQRTEWRVR